MLLCKNHQATLGGIWERVYDLYRKFQVVLTKWIKINFDIFRLFVLTRKATTLKRIFFEKNTNRRKDAKINRGNMNSIYNKFEVSLLVGKGACDFTMLAAAVSRTHRGF